jgi:hypothetical protein
VYDFLDLPGHVQHKIVQELGVEGLKEGEAYDDAYKRWFHEIKLKGEGFEKLRSLVTRELDDLGR